MLTKGDWQEWGPVTDQCHDRSGRPDKRRDKKLGQKSSKHRSFDARQLGCVFQDMTPPKSILRKGTDMQRPIQRVRFTKATARRTKIQDQNPSLGYICPGEPHQRSPNAPKFEDRSQEETEWQERWAREAAWKLAKNVLKLKRRKIKPHSSHLRKIGACLRHQPLNQRKENLLSTPERRCKWSAKKDLSDAELETVTTSKSPTTVITANGEVQTNEDTTVYVKELGFFLTMKVLEDTPAVLSPGNLCDEHGYSYEMDQRSKTTSH